MFLKTAVEALHSQLNKNKMYEWHAKAYLMYSDSVANISEDTKRAEKSQERFE